ncbi:alpha/beta hydrolase family esterase [Nocardia sp. NPDC020380]|uniref:alpha/beta hydrolase family esterase n=1 Tax=Nocardia sp. NPDC020380 TaxID=3364309 RepID=UPI0037B947E2
MKAVHLQVDGRRRSFVLQLPVVSRAGLPLLLVLHGRRSPVVAPIQRFAESVARRMNGFGACVDRYGIAVAYPEALDGAWADGCGVTTADLRGVNDTAFLLAVAEWCAEHHGTGRDGLLLAGMSNGAFMAHRAALEASESIAAFGAIAGGLPADLADHHPTHAVSALLINGTEDRAVPITGGYSRRRGPNGELRGRTLSLAETARRWAEIDRCTTDEAIDERPSGLGPNDLAITRRTAAEGVGGTRVETWTINGMGHTWPGARSPRILEPLEGKTPQNIDAAEELCRFALPLLIPTADRRLQDRQ